MVPKPIVSDTNSMVDRPHDGGVDVGEGCFLSLASIDMSASPTC